jgi:phosphoribosylanthranilate isomerase
MFAKDAALPERVRVKICGITTLADALVAIHGGADALGFNLVGTSRRHIDLRTESYWIRNLPVEVTRVAVMADPSWEELNKVAALPFIDAIQLHGHESPAFCRRVAEAGITFAKALPVDASGAMGVVPNFFTDTVVLDCSSQRGFGGTGETFDWMIGRQFVQEHSDLKVIVAGGLTPLNVAEAIRIMRPFAVDVTTGVELAPGRKDPGQVREFIAAARAV